MKIKIFPIIYEIISKFAELIGEITKINKKKNINFMNTTLRIIIYFFIGNKKKERRFWVSHKLINYICGVTAKPHKPQF